MQGARVLSLVGELRSRVLLSVAKKREKKIENRTPNYLETSYLGHRSPKSPETSHHGTQKSSEISLCGTKTQVTQIPHTMVLRLYISNYRLGTSLAVQWLRLHAPNAGSPGSIPGQGTRSYMPQLRVRTLQLKIPRATT